jgi:putative transposase
MPRIARVCAIDFPHHITQRGNNRANVFFEDDDRKVYLETLLKYSQKCRFEIWSYCLMSNHVHILAVPKRGESLSRGIGGTNLVYTQYINRKYRRSGRLWQNRFFSTIIDEESYLWAVVRYIERNPVRAKLVDRAEDYHWSSSRAHIFGIEDRVLTGEWLSEEERIAYKKFLQIEDRDIEGKLRTSTSTGRPFGGESFIKIIENILERRILPKKAGRHKKIVIKEK